MTSTAEQSGSKVPAVTLVFWIIKIAATTLGETAGDTITMTLGWGYLAGTAVFLTLLVVLIAIQIAASKFHPLLYWATIIASTTAGTTLADFADRSLGIGYAGGSALLLAGLIAVLGLWYWSLGSISVATVSTPKVEAFYWTAITLSQTLGTALGDWTADDTGLGYEGGALVFAAALAALALAYYLTNVSRVFLFWAAFILSRPLGATVGDLLDKPVSDGGLALSRPLASAVIGAFIVACLLLLPQGQASIRANHHDLSRAAYAAALGRAETSVCQRRRLASSSGTVSFDTFMKSTDTSVVMSATVNSFPATYGRSFSSPSRKRRNSNTRGLLASPHAGTCGSTITFMAGCRC